MSKKNKIAIALLGALFSNNSASAMNTNTNKNINKNLSVQTSGFSISKDSKLDSKTPQGVGTVKGASSHGNQSKGLTTGQKIGIGATALLAVCGITGFTIWGESKDDKKMMKDNQGKNKDNEKIDKSKKEMKIVKPKIESKDENIIIQQKEEIKNVKPKIKNNDEIVDYNRNLFGLKFGDNLRGFALVFKAMQQEKEFPEDYKSIQEAFRMNKKFYDIKVYDIADYKLKFSFAIEGENDYYYTIDAALFPMESKTTFNIKLGDNDEDGKIIYDYNPE